MSRERTRIHLDGHVAVVSLTRPDKHNALDAAMFAAIDAAAGEVAALPGVRAVVLCGEGPSFCSGLDVGSFMAEGSPGLEILLERSGPRDANLAQRVATNWLDLPVPVIAAIHGSCFGGGLQIALGADVRIAAPDAALSIMEARWGLVPDMGITHTLPRLVGIDVARELTYTARRVSGEQAVALGLVTRVAPDPLGAALELAEEIAGRSPDAVRAAKRLFEAAWPAPAAGSLELETELQSALMGSPNQIAAVVAGLAGEPARFHDPT